MQLKCCGVRSVWDYTNNTLAWEPRNEVALAPVTCCMGLRSIDNTYPPTATDTMHCVARGADSNAYHNQVRLIDLILYDTRFIGSKKYSRHFH